MTYSEQKRASPLNLNNNEIDLCLPFGHVHKMEPEQLIQQRGDKSQGLSIVVKGTVKIGNYGKDGKYFLTRISGVGETFGEFTLYSGLPRTHSVLAGENCEILVINQQQFNQLISSKPQLLTKLLAMMSTKLHYALEMLEDVRRLPVNVRVAKLILTLTQIEHTNRVNMTQNALADFIGVTVLAVHKALKELEQKHLIKLSYGKIEIPDCLALKTWVEENDLLIGLTSASSTSQ